jgi:hypothetical protein
LDDPLFPKILLENLSSAGSAIPSASENPIKKVV